MVVIDEAARVTVSLSDVFGSCSVAWIIRDIEYGRFDGTLDVKESWTGFEGFAAIDGNAAVNENMAVMRGQDKIAGSIKTDALVGTCTVSATELWEDFA